MPGTLRRSSSGKNGVITTWPVSAGQHSQRTQAARTAGRLACQFVGGSILLAVVQPRTGLMQLPGNLGGSSQVRFAGARHGADDPSAFLPIFSTMPILPAMLTRPPKLGQRRVHMAQLAAVIQLACGRRCRWFR